MSHNRKAPLIQPIVLSQRLLWGLGLLGINVIANQIYWSLIILALALLITFYICHVQFWDWFRSGAIPLGFVIMALIPFIWSQQFALAGLVVSRSLAGLCCLLLLICTCSISEFIAFARYCHSPEEILDIVILIYRFITLLLESAQTMTQAQVIRLGTINWRRRIVSLSLLATELLPHALQKAEALEQGLKIRGLEEVSLYAHGPIPKAKKRDLFWQGAGLSLLLGLSLWF